MSTRHIAVIGSVIGGIAGAGEEECGPLDVHAALPALVIALLVWIGLCTVAIVIFQQVTFAYAWMWAHAELQSIQNPPSAAQLLAITLGGLLLRGGSGVILHRVVRSSAPAS